jgi:hypothetical protein
VSAVPRWSDGFGPPSPEDRQTDQRVFGTAFFFGVSFLENAVIAALTQD